MEQLTIHFKCFELRFSIFFFFVRSFVCNNDAMQSTHCGLIQRNEDESAFQMNKPLTEIPATKNQTNSKCHSKAWDEDGNTTLHSQTLCESSETVYWLESHFGNDKDIGIERQQQCQRKTKQTKKEEEKSDVPQNDMRIALVFVILIRFHGMCSFTW